MQLAKQFTHGLINVQVPQTCAAATHFCSVNKSAVQRIPGLEHHLPAASLQKPVPTSVTVVLSFALALCYKCPCGCSFLQTSRVQSLVRWLFCETHSHSLHFCLQLRSGSSHVEYRLAHQEGSC